MTHYDRRAVPLFNIAIETTPVNIETDAPDIAVDGKDWQIPLVQLGSASTVQFHPSSFDTEVREPGNRRRQQLTMPVYHCVSPSRIRFIPDLAIGFHDEIRRLLERFESNKADEAGIQESEMQEEDIEAIGGSEARTSSAESAAATGSGGHSDKSSGEVPTFQEIIFNGAGSATTTPDGTTIVLFNEVVSMALV